MSVLLESFPPNMIGGVVNLKMRLQSSSSVVAEPLDGQTPAYFPVVRAGNAPGAITGEVRYARIDAQSSQSMNILKTGDGGITVGTPLTEDTGYDVYGIVSDDLEDTALIATQHGTALVYPAGWGGVYESVAPLGYVCCNMDNGAGVFNRILPFVQVAPGKFMYRSTDAQLAILENWGGAGIVTVQLATSAGTRKAQFPSTAREVDILVVATNDDASVGNLLLYLSGTAITPTYTLGSIGGSAVGNSDSLVVPVPCTGHMDSSDLFMSWSGLPGNPHTSIYALGFTL